MSWETRPIDRASFHPELCHRCEPIAGGRSDSQIGRRRKELLHPNRLELRREALFDEGIGDAHSCALE